MDEDDDILRRQRWTDDDGDGVHDLTGEDRETYQYNRDQGVVPGVATGFGESAADRPQWRDADGDGRDDRTGVQYQQFERSRDSWDRQQGAARSNADARQAERQYDEYTTSGQRTRDLDAGLSPERDPRRSGQWIDSDGDGVEEWQETAADIPLVGWLSGAGDAVARADALSREQQNIAIWGDLANYMPTPDDLTVDYEGEAFIEDGLGESSLASAAADPAAIEAERRALEQMEDIYSSGGMTGADRMRLAQGEREMGRAMRSQREADESTLRSRGMGNSGAMLSSMLSAQQGGADMLADREADIQARAEARAMDALAGASSTAGRMRGQSFQEDATRRGGADDYNRWDTDARRESNRWNVQQRNRARESRAGARQQAYQNREQQAAGMTSQYSSDQSRRLSEQQRRDQADRDRIAGLGEWLDL